MTACGSCGAEVWWAVSFSSGKRMPIDPDPAPDGNVLLAESRPDGTPVVRVVGRGGDAPDGPRFVSHFATCPNASRHRRSPR